MANMENGGPAPARRQLNGPAASIWSGGDPFRPLEPEVRVVQFDGPLSEGELRQAAAIVLPRPDVWLRVYPRAAENLSFLRHFEGLQKLSLDIYDLKSLDGLEFVAKRLRCFEFHKTRRVAPIGFLLGMPDLVDLFIEGPKKDIDVICKLEQLTSLSLRGTTVIDLGIFSNLADLRELSLRLGNTSDLRALPQFEKLELLDLMRLTGLADLSMLAELPTLQSLTLDWLRNVRSLPSFACLPRLNSVAIDAMKGLQSLHAIAAAPALERLSVLSSPQFHAVDFECFQDHPTLTWMHAAPGGMKVYREIKKMFPGIAV